MMYRSTLLLLLLTALSSAEVNAPRVGFVRYADATVRSIDGVEASFVVGPPVQFQVDAASFSGGAGIWSRNGQIEIVTAAGTVSASIAGEREALVGIDGSLSTAIAWLPETRVLRSFDGARFHSTEVLAALPGKALCVRSNGEAASLLVESDGAVSEITISLSSGNILSEDFLPAVQAPAAYVANFIVYANERGLQIREQDGTLRTLPFHLGENTVFERMAGNWLHIETGGQPWALQVLPKRLQLSELPLPAMAVRR
jgi:hypothetical protein